MSIAKVETLSVLVLYMPGEGCCSLAGTGIAFALGQRKRRRESRAVLLSWLCSSLFLCWVPDTCLIKKMGFPVRVCLLCLGSKHKCLSSSCHFPCRRIFSARSLTNFLPPLLLLLFLHWWYYGNLFPIQFLPGSCSALFALQRLGLSELSTSSVWGVVSQCKAVTATFLGAF